MDRPFQVLTTICADLGMYTLLVPFESLSFGQQNKEEIDFTIPGFHKNTFYT